MISKALEQIIPTDIKNQNACSARCNQTLFFIALITIPDLQFNDIVVFQEWFSKRSNSL